MDIERAKELKTSMIWASVVEEMDKKIHFETQDLKKCKPEELLNIQARIHCYETLRRLPDDVIDREE